MSAIDALRNGDLSKALADLQSDVRASPDDPRHRVFLFQLLSVLGQWDRALAQLDVVLSLDPAAVAMVKTYEAVLQCEVYRQGVFAGERSPLILGEAESWVAEMVEAVRLSAKGDHEAARRLREHAYESAPPTAGSLSSADGPGDSAGAKEIGFEWVADADSRLGPLLEVIVNGRYYWLPFHRVRQINIDPPEDLRDLVWLPARFLLANEGEAVGMIPTRYAGSEARDDSQIRLGRKTEWLEPLEGTFEGLGQRILTTDQGEYGLMNLRQLRFAG
jgi:type VI secretion system protein ImpE